MHMQLKSFTGSGSMTPVKIFFPILSAHNSFINILQDLYILCKAFIMPAECVDHDEECIFFGDVGGNRPRRRL